jgi:hypothetical protein
MEMLSFISQPVSGGYRTVSFQALQLFAQIVGLTCISAKCGLTEAYRKQQYAHREHNVSSMLYQGRYG